MSRIRSASYVCINVHMCTSTRHKTSNLVRYEVLAMCWLVPGHASRRTLSGARTGGQSLYSSSHESDNTQLAKGPGTARLGVRHFSKISFLKSFHLKVALRKIFNPENFAPCMHFSKISFLKLFDPIASTCHPRAIHVSTCHQRANVPPTCQRAIHVTTCLPRT